MSWSQQDTSFKKLSNKRVTTSTGKGLPEEKGASTLELYLPDIKTELIPGTGNTAYGLTGNLFYYGPTSAFGQTLVVDTSVPNNLTWFATSGYGNTTTANDGSAGSEANRLMDWVSDKYDAFGTVSGAGYEIKLYDGSGNLVTKSDASNWLFDYQTGILMFNNTQLSSGSAVSTSGPYKIVGWRYVGQKGTVPAYYGGSGYTTYTKGDLLVGAGSTFIKLNVGSDNYVLSADSSTASGLKWVVNSGSGSAISNLNGLTATTQYFAVGTSGSLFNISSSGSTHTFNIPIAGSGSTGLVSTGSQTFAGQKTFTSSIIGDLTGTATTAGYATTANYANSTGLATSSGIATTAFNLNIVSAVSGTFYPLFTNISTTTSGVAVSVDSNISYDASTDTLTTGKFSGLFSGSAGTFTNIYGTLSGTATTATNILIGNASSNASHYLTFSSPATSSSGLALSSNTNLTYNPSGNGTLSLGTGQAIINGLTLGATSNTITTSSGNLTLNSAGGTVVVGGNFNVQGTATYIDSTTATLTDPVVVLGSGAGGTHSTVTDTQDRGIEYRRYSGSAITGFFGFSNSSGRFTFIPNANVTANNTYSGSIGVIEANITGSAITATNIYGALIGNASTATTAGLATTAQNVYVTGQTTGTFYPVFTNVSSTTNGVALSVESSLSWDAATNTLTAGKFSGLASGVAATFTNFYGTLVGSATTAGVATTAFNVNIVSANIGTFYPLFTSNSSTSSGAAISIDGSDISYNFATNTFTAGTFSGNLSATAATATNFYGTLAGNVSGTSTTSQNINVVSATTGTFYPLFTNISSSASGVAVSVDSGISFDSATDTLTAGKFSGLHSGSAATFTNIYGTLVGSATTSGFATTASNINIVSANTGTFYPLFTNISTSASGVAVSVDSGISFDSATDTLTAGKFSGLASGSAATFTNFYGTLTGLATTATTAQNILSTTTSQNTDITVALISGTAISYNSSLVFNASTGRLAATSYTGNWAGSTITAFYGGTGNTIYSKGDLLVGIGGTLIRLAVGTDNYVLTASSGSATGLTWSPTAATGITTLNTLTATTQYFTTGTSGSSFNISSSGSTHTFNIPIAGTGATGLVSTQSQTFAGSKTFTGDVVITSSTASTYMANGALTVNGGVGISGQLSVNQVAMGYTGIATNPVMAFIGSTNTAPITMSVLSDGSLLWEGSSGKLFGINNNLSSGWIFNVGDISGLPIIRANADGTIAMAEFAANVGIGLSNPSYKLHVAGDTNLSSGYVYRINGTSVLSSTQVLGLTVTSGNITSGAWSGTAISVLYGGTGLTSYTVGDILYASGSATIGRLTAGSAGSILVSAGAGATPYYSSPALFTSGNATTAANINIVSATTGTFYPLFTNVSSTTSGVAVSVDSGISFDSATDTLTAGKFSGLHSGTAATFTNIYGTLTGFATTATNVNSVSTTGTNSSHFLMFSPVNGGSGVALSSGIGLTFNPLSGQLGLGTGSALINGLLLGTSANTITTTSGNLTLNSAGGTVLVAGNFNVQGTATYIDSTTQTITDPVIVVGSGAGGTHTNVVDTQDRGIEYRRFSGSAITGFFGYSNSSGRFTFIPNANITAANTYTGSVGVIEANITGTAITATNLYGALIGNAASATTAGLATTAQNLNISTTTTGTLYPLFTSVSTSASGVAVSVDGTDISYDAATNTLTAGKFSGLHSGTAATFTNIYGSLTGSATTATNINVVLAATNASHQVLFTPTSGTASGVAVSSENSFVYNPSTDILSVSGLAVTSSTASTSSSTGALIVTGGVGIGNSVNIGGRVGIGTNLLNSALNVQIPSTTTSGLIIRGNTSQTSDAITYFSASGATQFAADANGRIRLTGMDGIWNNKVQQNIFDVSDSRVNWNLQTWQYSSIYWTTAGATIGQAANQLAISNAGTTSITGVGIYATGWDTGGANRVFGIVSPSGSERTYFKGYGNLVINPNNPNGLHNAWNTMDLITLDISGTASTYAGNIILGKVEATERFSVGPFGNTRITVGSATTATGLLVKAVASQSGNLIETQASTGVTNFYVSPTGGASFSDNVEIKSAKEVRFNNTGNTFYTGFKAGANASNTTYTLPIAFPGSGTSILQSDTSGTLTWTGITGWATTATNLNVVAALSNTSHPLLFTPTSGSASGLAVSSNATLVYNPSSSILSVSGLAVTATTTSTSSSSGALIISGGVGIGGSLYTSTSYADSISGVVLNNGVITSGSWAGSTITGRYGGTGYSTYTKGDLLVGAGSTIIKFGVGLNNQILIADSNAGSGLSWAQFANPTYGSFYSTSTQQVAGAGVTTLVTFNSTYEANRVAIIGGSGTSSRIQIQDSGPFSLTFSAQINLVTGNQPKVGDLWFRVNGVDVAQSNTEMTITGKDYQTCLTVNFVSTFQANDYVEIVMSSSDSQYSLEAKTGLVSPPRPDIPSIILSVLPVTHVIGSSGTATSGIQSLNGSVNISQAFATGTSGTDFNISTGGATHTFNIPDASTSARGLITTGSQTLLGAKTFASGVAITASTGSTSTSTGALVVSGGVGIGGSLYSSTSYANSISGVVLNNGIITSGSWSGSTITGLYGGTGYTNYTKGDLLVGAGNTFVKLSTGTDGYVLGANSNLPSGLGWTTVSGVAISTSAPSAPKNADLWFNSEDGSLSVYYQDVDTSQWVEIAIGSGVDFTSDIHITSTTGSTSTSTGALIVDGGAGIAGTVNAQSFVVNGLYDQIGTSLTTSATTANQVALTLSTSTYRSAKIFVQASAGSTYHSQEIMMLHDGTNVYMTEYSMVNSGAIGSTFDGDISGGNMRFLVTPTYAVTTYKIACSAMRI